MAALLCLLLLFGSVREIRPVLAEIDALFVRAFEDAFRILSSYAKIGQAGTA